MTADASHRVIHRGFRYRLAPTPDQAAQFRQFAGVCRLIYNLALEQRRDFWQQYRKATGGALDAFSQGLELKDLRAEFDWIAAVPQSCQAAVLRDLDKAFDAFFARRAGYPRPRRKGQDEAFRLLGRATPVRRLNAKWSAVRLPKIGWVKYRDTRPMRGRALNATVAYAAGEWHIAFACEIAHEIPAARPGAVGIDRGVANAITLSTGEMLRVPDTLTRLDKAARRAQRVLARRKRGSKRRARQQARIARLMARQARIRADFNHRASHAVAERFGTVAIEALNIGGMTRSAAGTVAEPGRNVAAKSGLNRAILSRGWGQFERQLAYKLDERGGRLVRVDPRHTSQTCAACGGVDSGSRASQARFRCVACGHTDHADVNAALEILRRGSASSLRVEARAKARPAKREPRAAKAGPNRAPMGVGGADLEHWDDRGSSGAPS